jgi:aspartyl-tRNA synthetase
MILDMRTNIADCVTKIGEVVTIFGWAQTVRDHKKIVFMDVRDKSGVVQVVGGSDMAATTQESCVKIVGFVKSRPEKLINANLLTGTIEIEVQEFTLLNKAAAMPIPVLGDGYDINEEARLAYRYIDLRRERMQKIVALRNTFIQTARQALLKQDFTEVETPILSMATKEGARDFLVPSRHQPGKFYALPQSPQQYKQLLMVAGIEKYFQFAKCFRDEDLRADRGFEFTQLDVEMSFVEQSDVMQTIETTVKEAVKACGGKLKDETFPIYTYTEAIQKFGADKFDLRNEEEKTANIQSFAWVIKFPFFKKVDKADVAEVIDGKSGYTFTHNPFSAPIPEHMDWLLNGERVEEILTTQYDLVCNGLEAGGGSIRNHSPETLKAVYAIMGYTQEETMASVGHIIEALGYGAPPHGGIALGVDRIVANLAGEDGIKEVIAFPQTASGKTAVMQAPVAIDSEALKELGIKVI